MGTRSSAWTSTRSSWASFDRVVGWKSFSAQRFAAAEHVPGDRIAKPVGVVVDGTLIDLTKTEFDVLATLVEDWEEKHQPVYPPDPVAAIRFRMEQLDLDRKALEPSIGSRARVSEVLSGRRRLTLDMIRRLHRDLGIPAEVLLAS